MCVKFICIARMSKFIHNIRNQGCRSRVIVKNYIGMTKQHLGVRVEEYLHSKKDSAVQNHITVCQSCKGNKQLFNNFCILKTCNTQGSTKIQEALLVKKHNTKLSTRLYASVFSFLLNAFQFIRSFMLV